MSSSINEQEEVKQLQNRASAAEQKLVQLQATVNNNQDERLNEFKKQVLDKLQHLKQTLIQEREEIGNQEDNKQLKKEREDLRTENEKLKYRIKILLRSLEEEEKKNQST
jgi:uncharacterized membrane protein YccC